jgi:molybdopterin converting factor subunit 1
MKCKIKAFGISKEIIGSTFLEMELQAGNTVADLKKNLFNKYPAFSDLNSLYVALNNEYADEKMVLKEGDEIALIPPVSGG